MINNDDDDDLTKQALDYFMENNTLKRRVFPYLCGIAFFNIIIFITLIYIAIKITVNQLQPVQSV